ncbi:2-amino-4-hydroxy-6-hydroxymethyldihydropteridine diphosphokinase [Haloferula rosea]|uniref:2-amino-4-hydroxy-6-hydroxymethyldihydropteridine pyrophosphokinase n=1 Tax=Haloferula rosea TaxID=490093 RepID=A0A934VFU9_9BACT|nr:2-amino-4-hydroxy-6-hydroxymethyldihydropteridine diphosphokinase [Haloferula rosea]MBK1826955.1 2-amino-4-hydroxy-6-hydroxymethyldihydropteridine diphosphokinase [Haloferula rosea]
MACRTAIALGSNLGDRLAHLQAARDRLQQLALPGDAFLQASIYQTAPVACPDDSPDFLNTVVEFSYPGSPSELLAHTQSIELALGRVRDGTPNAPRTLDLDLLYFGDQQIHLPQLELPHPRLAQRRFVLEPLAEIRPDLIIPGQSQTTRHLLTTLPSSEAPLEKQHSRW